MLYIFSSSKKCFVWFHFSHWRRNYLMVRHGIYWEKEQTNEYWDRDSSPSGGPLAAGDVPRELDGKMLGTENKKVSEEEAGERSDSISAEGGELGIWQLWETGWGSQAMWDSSLQSWACVCSSFLQPHILVAEASTEHSWVVTKPQETNWGLSH